MALVAPEEGRKFYDPEDFSTQVREYVRAKQAIDSLDKRAKELRDIIMQAVDLQGEVDANGNIVLPLDDAIEGVVALEKQRRASRKLDETLAESIIDSKGLGDTLFEIKRVVNEEALMAAYYNDLITEEELDSMFPVTVTWALRTPRK